MHHVLNPIISVEQDAFIAGWSISDNILMAQAIMYDMRRASPNRCYVAIDLDMEQVYG